MDKAELFMSLSYGILGFLTYGSMTGYDLAKSFASSLQFFWHAQTSQVYLELGKLEEKGFVKSERVLQTEKPNKRLYTITDKGRAEFLGWLCGQNEDISKGSKNIFLMKVFFSGSRPTDQSAAMFRQFAEHCRERLKAMEEIPVRIEKSGASQPEEALFWAFTADYGTRYLNMCIDWAEACIEKLGGKL